MELDLNPVTFITTDAFGEPGHRVFYLQARASDREITLLVEKAQIQSLAIGVEQYLSELSQQYPNMAEASPEFTEEEMHIITEPNDTLFRVGEFGLGYEVDSDKLILVARQISEEGQEVEDLGEVRFWCSRSQIRRLCHWGIELSTRGRPICPQCNEPINPEGHLCPKKNGHKH